MIEKAGRERVGRRAWPWMALAVLASAVPFVLVVMTVTGGISYLPISSFAWHFIGVEARYLLPIDFLVTGGLPLLALVAAAASWLWWPTGMAGATLLGIVTVVNLVVFVDYFPWPLTSADISVGSEPDFYTDFGDTWVSPLLAAIACTAGAAALVVGSRRLRANRLTGSEAPGR